MWTMSLTTGLSDINLLAVFVAGAILAVWR